MALTPRLDLRQTQSLVMTPQLQQAIKLLQFSSLELSAYVETQLEQNPLLDRDDPDESFEPNSELNGRAGRRRHRACWRPAAIRHPWMRRSPAMAPGSPKTTSTSTSTTTSTTAMPPATATGRPIR